MKILIICRPRTRSTFLINALSEYYNLENKDENYKFCHGKLNNTFIDNNRFNLFSSCIKQATQNNFKQENFAIKLFPRMLTLSNYKIDALENYKLEIISDLSYFVNLKKYDKVFFLYRNIVDSVCSWAYGNYLNQFNFYEEKTFNSIKAQTTNIEINVGESPILKFYILESVILDCWKVLLDKNIDCTALDYSEIPEFVKMNYHNIITKSIDNQFDYKKIITNYETLENQILDYYNLCYEQLKSIEYK